MEESLASASSSASSQRTRVLVILGGAVVMQFSPGSREHVVRMCRDEGGLFPGWFCRLDPEHRVGLCVSVVSSVFLADVIVAAACLARTGMVGLVMFIASCAMATNRATISAWVRSSRRGVIAVAKGVLALAKYFRRAATGTLRALGFKSRKQTLFEWPTSFVRRARDRWRAAFQTYVRAKKRPPKRPPKKKQQPFDLRRTLLSEGVLSEEPAEDCCKASSAAWEETKAWTSRKEADDDDESRGAWEETKEADDDEESRAWEETKAAPSASDESSRAREATTKAATEEAEDDDDSRAWEETKASSSSERARDESQTSSSSSEDSRKAPGVFWGLASAYFYFLDSLTEGERRLFPWVVEEKKKKRREFPLVFLLATAIGVVGVTTGIEARQLWTEHAAATKSVERYLATSLVLRIGAAVHETQLERGLASTYLGNRKQSRDALRDLELQYDSTDDALCAALEALLRHADVSPGATTLAQPPPHEMAALVAPIFGINANRRRDSPEFRRSTAACSAVEKPGKDSCKSSRCRQLAAILSYLQSVAPSSEEAPSRAASFEFYTGVNRNLLRLATNACVELVRNLRAGPSLAASLLYAYVNLAAFKEKAGIERGVVSAELAFALTADRQSILVQHRRVMANLHVVATDGSTVENRSATTTTATTTMPRRIVARSPSLSALVRLREVVAQQDVYLSSFLAFATHEYATEYDRLRSEACVLSSHEMRLTLLRRLRDIETTIGGGGFFDYAPDLLDDAAQYVFSVSNNDKKQSPPSSLTFDEGRSDQALEAQLLLALHDMAENDDLWFTPRQWWANQTCRIDHLHRISESLALAVHAQAEKARRGLERRAVRLAAPLLACFVATLLVGLRAMRAYIDYRDSTERRVLKLETRRLHYRDLLSRWAPLSSWMLDDDSHDDDSSNNQDDASQTSSDFPDAHAHAHAHAHAQPARDRAADDIPAIIKPPRARATAGLATTTAAAAAAAMGRAATPPLSTISGRQFHHHHHHHRE
ncbi:hypothetical protein CTAYLR_009395 [Chrysophaeum taylorii]|uniref:Nitrate/nitrite sensing protein domain-containing protein n=1 Tax=Chrysophaeum taylorii TaxID=2483200 RepID=A0AAD7UJH9_9STRA|nr:hypothetical protein CTAYLR_009395 [Chrysophaeum taylorii]